MLHTHKPISVEIIKYQRLQQRLGYEFRDGALLQLALTHRSYGAQNNERLEFLGDSILNFIIGEALFLQFVEAREGQLSRLRAHMVKGKTLAEIGRDFNLGECLILGEGEMKSGGHRRDSIIADAVEAIIGAIYTESGIEVCRARVLDWYAARLQSISLDDVDKDAKTRLQEYMQSRQQPLPEYVVVETAGEAHAQVFTIECRVGPGNKVGRAQASNRREAEKQAAAQVLRALNI
jgi:ribonuclease-3